MECIPAIDLLGGRCVRLVRGTFSEVTDFGDPIERARKLVADGATRLHVVDLDGARGEGVDNATLIAALLKAIEIPLEVGGGVRDDAAADRLFELGVDRVVLGTATLEDRALLERLVGAHPGGIVVGLDHRRGTLEGREVRLVALRGWTTTTTTELEDALSSLSGLDLAGVLVTDITRDGTLEGPDLAGYARALSSTNQPIIASGGVGSLADLRALGTLSVEGRRLAGVVVGRAILSGAISMKEAVEACEP